SGSTPRNGTGSIATDTADRPRPARIWVSSPPVADDRESFFDPFVCLGSGCFGCPSTGPPLDPGHAGEGRKCHDLPASDPPATAALDCDRRVPGQPGWSGPEPGRGRRRRRLGHRRRGHGWRNDVPWGSKPTVVLVHGAWADSGSWDQVVARLQRRGYPVIAFPTPLRSLPDDSASLAAFLGSVPGPIVLVGHSYGGAVVTNAATGNDNVKALFYVDAFLPAQGEPLAQLLGPPPGS